MKHAANIHTAQAISIIRFYKSVVAVNSTRRYTVNYFLLLIQTANKVAHHAFRVTITAVTIIAFAEFKPFRPGRKVQVLQGAQNKSRFF
jgi:histone H3/H4